MIQTIQIKGLSVLGVMTAALLALSFLTHRLSSPWIQGLLMAAGLQSMAAYWGLLWSLNRSNRIFFSVFVSDALLRMVALALATAWLVSTHRPFTAPLLWFASAYGLLSLVQIPFFHKVR